MIRSQSLTGKEAVNLKAIDKSGAIKHQEDVMDWVLNIYNPSAYSVRNMKLRKMHVDCLIDNLKNTGSLIIKLK